MEEGGKTPRSKIHLNKKFLLESLTIQIRNIYDTGDVMRQKFIQYDPRTGTVAVATLEMLYPLFPLNFIDNI